MAYKQKGWSAYDRTPRALGTHRIYGPGMKEIKNPKDIEKERSLRKQHKAERKELTKELRAEHGWGLGLSKKKTEPRAELREKQEKERRDAGIYKTGANPMNDDFHKPIKIKEFVSPFYKAEDGDSPKVVPRVPIKSPSEEVKRLQAKKDAGTITATELAKLRKLRKMMETGPGSYGNEQWDKE